MKFSELKPGNIFRYAGDNYIKTEKVAVNTDYIVSIAIKLKDGGIHRFEDDEDVIQIQ